MEAGSSWKRIGFSLAMAGLWGSLTSCGSPGAGQPCTAGACSDSSNALFCQGGVYVAIPCKGAVGCASAGGQITCDQSRDSAGDPCPSDKDGSGICSASASDTALTCVGGVLVSIVCGGPCSMAGSVLDCTPGQGSGTSSGSAGAAATTGSGSGTSGSGTTGTGTGTSGSTSGTIGNPGCPSCTPGSPGGCPTGETCAPARPGASQGFCALPCDPTALTCASAQSTCVYVGTNAVGASLCYPWACMGLGQPGTGRLAHEPWPQIPSQGGAVVGAPQLVVITPDAQQYPYTSEIQAFGAELMSSPYLADVGAEYGVGGGAFLGSVTVSTPFPAVVDDPTIQSSLLAAFSSGSLTAPVQGSVYMLYYPSTTTIYQDSAHTAASCGAFAGYHKELTWNGIQVLYGVIAACGPNTTLGVSELQAIEAATSHELIEAATDPLLSSAWSYPDPPDAQDPWALAGGEVGDMCFDVIVGLDQSGNVAQRIWSNVQAQQSVSPCSPQVTGTIPSFTAVASLPYSVLVKAGSAVVVPVIPWSSGTTPITSISFFPAVLGAYMVDSSAPVMSSPPDVIVPVTLTPTAPADNLSKMFLYGYTQGADYMFWPIALITG